MLAGRNTWPDSDARRAVERGDKPVAGAGHGFNDTNPAGSRSGQETSQKERGALAEDRFDTLTHRLATASMSRRDVIGVIGGVFAGAAASTSFGTQRASAQPGQLPQQIYVIRHGEKPPKSGPPFGVDFDGDRNPNSLSPRGWQRSGALTALFSPDVAPKVGLRTPTALYATAYVDASVTQIHRPYQTLLGLSRRLGLPIQSPDLIGRESRLRGRGSGRRRRGGADLLRTSPHTGAGARHPHRRRHRCPRRLARRPLRRHLDLFAEPRDRTLRVQSSPRTTFERRHRHGDLSL